MILWAIAHPILATLFVGLFLICYGWIVAWLSYGEGYWYGSQRRDDDAFLDGWAAAESALGAQQQYRRTGSAGRAQWQ